MIFQRKIDECAAMTREEFRKIDQKPGLFECKTSGSTGVSVCVQKYARNDENNKRHKRLFDIWHDWDTKAKTLKLGPAFTKPTCVNDQFFLYNQYVPGPYTQLISFPSLMPNGVELTKFKRVMSYGESWRGIGIDQYSSEEFGCIAIQCPVDPNHMHIMANLEIVFTDDGMRITDHDHPYLKDYEIGDYATRYWLHLRHRHAGNDSR